MEIRGYAFCFRMKFDFFFPTRYKGLKIWRFTNHHDSHSLSVITDWNLCQNIQTWLEWIKKRLAAGAPYPHRIRRWGQKSSQTQIFQKGVAKLRHLRGRRFAAVRGYFAAGIKDWPGSTFVWPWNDLANVLRWRRHWVDVSQDSQVATIAALNEKPITNISQLMPYGTTCESGSGAKSFKIFAKLTKIHNVFVYDNCNHL